MTEHSRRMDDQNLLALLGDLALLDWIIGTGIGFALVLIHAFLSH